MWCSDNTIEVSILETAAQTCPTIPDRALLDTDVTLSEEQVHKYVDAILSRMNCLVVTTRDLVLVKNLGASLKVRFCAKRILN